MPFTTTRKLPRDLREMPPGARKVWTAAFTQALSEDPEDLAAEAAFAAVSKVFKKGEDGLWTTRSEEEQDPGYDPKTDPESDEYDPKLDPDSDEYDPDLAAQHEEELAQEMAAAGEDDPEADPNADPNADPDEESDVEVKVGGGKKKKRPAFLSKRKGTTDSMQVTELFALDAAGFRLTNDGYLVAAPRVARTGIQIYRGAEVGRPDMQEVRVYRPEKEVFSRKAMASLAHRPITLDHPDRKVDASNFRELGVGKSDGDVARDGDFVRVPLVLMDAHAIAAAQSGKSQLSVGYGAKLKWGAGQAPDGQLYDAVQTEIRANHIALVESARGGHKLKIGDGKKKDRGPARQRKGMKDATNNRRLNMAEMNIDGVTIELDDKDAQILDRHLNGVRTKLRANDGEVATLKTQVEDLQTKLAAAQTATGTKDGEIVALKAQLADAALTPKKMDEALKTRMDIIDRATAFFGNQKYIWADKTDAEIKRDVAIARLGDQAKAMDDNQIEGAFLSLTATQTQQQDGLSRVTQSFSRAPVAGGFNDRAATAYDKRNEELANRYKANKKPFVASA